MTAGITSFPREKKEACQSVWQMSLHEEVSLGYPCALRHGMCSKTEFGPKPMAAASPEGLL